MLLKIFPGNTQTITLPGVVDSETGAPIAGADVKATLYDKNDNTVTGFVDLAMTDEGQGSYELTLPATFNPDPGKGYYVIYTGTKSGVTFRRRQDAEVLEAEI